MASYKNIKRDGVRYKLYEQSIILVGVPRAIWFKRPVNEKDVDNLHEIYLLGLGVGARKQKEKLQRALAPIKELLGISAEYSELTWIA